MGAATSSLPYFFVFHVARVLEQGTTRTTKITIEGPTIIFPVFVFMHDDAGFPTEPMDDHGWSTIAGWREKYSYLLFVNKDFLMIKMPRQDMAGATGGRHPSFREEERRSISHPSIVQSWITFWRDRMGWLLVLVLETCERIYFSIQLQPQRAWY